MQIYNSLAGLAGLLPPPVPEPEKPAPAPRIYDCTGCRFVDSNGLVCGFCLRKILDGQADRRMPTRPKGASKVSLLAACFDGHSMTLLRGRSTVLV